MDAIDIYWDSCVFIHLLQRTPEYVDALDMTLAKARAKQCRIITSCVTIAEVCKLPELGALPIEQTEKILDFFRNEFVVSWQADRWACLEAHHLQRHFPLLPMDAIHLATALQAKVKIAFSTDTKKYRRNGLLDCSKKIGNPPLIVEIPSVSVFMPLWKLVEDAAKEALPPAPNPNIEKV